MTLRPTRRRRGLLDGARQRAKTPAKQVRRRFRPALPATARAGRDFGQIALHAALLTPESGGWG